MNQLKEFDRLRPADESLDEAARERIWAEIVGSRTTNPSADRASANRTDLADHASLALLPTTTQSAPRRRLALLGAAAVAIVGLGGVIAVQLSRDTPQSVKQQAPRSVSTEPAATVAETGGAVSAALPAWHHTLRPLIPERFDYLALTSSTGDSATFVAINSSAGKSLELRVSNNSGTSSRTDGVVDEAGTWTSTPQGWQLITPGGLTAEVSCNIGAQGRDFAGPPNYCEMASTGPISKQELRDITAAVANPILLDGGLAATASPMTATTSDVAAHVTAAIPSETLIGDTTWTEGDHVWDFSSSSDRPDTSIRIVAGIQAPPAETTTPAVGLYDDAAAFWIIHPSGTGLRVSTTDPRPESVERLTDLAQQIMRTIVADVDVVADVEAARAVAGNVKVGDTCDKIDQTVPEIPLDPLAMRPVVAYSPDGACTVVGWSYLGLPPEGAPGLMPPDEDGFIPVPVYADDGEVEHLDLPSPQERQSLRDYVASMADLEINQD